jgi:hypothetical protein
MLSAGVGAGAVTTWCMLHGQSPGEAATITVLSTITALVSRRRSAAAGSHGQAQPRGVTYTAVYQPLVLL